MMWSRGANRRKRERERMEAIAPARTSEARNAINRAVTAIDQAQEGLDEMKSLNSSIHEERVKNHFGQIMFDAMRPPK